MTSRLLLGFVIFATTAATVLSASLTKADVNSLFTLEKKALALTRDINTSSGFLNQSTPSLARPDQLDCLEALGHILDTTGDKLSAISDLVQLSVLVENGNDRNLVNEFIDTELSYALKQLSNDRKGALLQGASCSQSALVTGYVQQATSILDKAVDIFDDLERRVK